MLLVPLCSAQLIKLRRKCSSTLSLLCFEAPLHNQRRDGIFSEARLMPSDASRFSFKPCCRCADQHRMGPAPAAWVACSVELWLSSVERSGVGTGGYSEVLLKPLQDERSEEGEKNMREETTRERRKRWGKRRGEKWVGKYFLELSFTIASQTWSIFTWSLSGYRQWARFPRSLGCFASLELLVQAEAYLALYSYPWKYKLNSWVTPALHWSNSTDFNGVLHKTELTQQWITPWFLFTHFWYDDILHTIWLRFLVD